MASPAFDLSIRRASTAEILPLRHAELRPGLPIETAEFDGDEDAATRHFAAFDPRGEAVGCASFMAKPWEMRPAYQLRGMATRSDFVRQGIGASLLRFAEESLQKELGVDCLWCNARAAAVDFYRGQGWAVASGAFDIPGVGPHHRMTKSLPPAV